MRMCLGCREMKPKKDLMRVVRTERGTVEYDPSSKKNGRGAYLCRRTECLVKAAKNKCFYKALGSELPPDMLEEMKNNIITI